VAGPAAGHAYVPLSGAGRYSLSAAVLPDSRVASWCRSWMGREIERARERGFDLLRASPN
jgi:hypothetical protein